MGVMEEQTTDYTKKSLAEIGSDIVSFLVSLVDKNPLNEDAMVVGDAVLDKIRSGEVYSES